MNNYAIFFRRGKYYYYKYKNNIIKVNEDSLLLLKDNIEYPFMIEFCGVCRAAMSRIIGTLKDEDIDIKINPIYEDKLIRFKVLFSKDIKLKM